MCEVVVYGKGGEPYLLDHLAAITGLRYTTGWGNGLPGGCQELSFGLDLLPEEGHPGIGIGRRIEVWAGCARPWVGQISEIAPGEPWRIVGKGLSYRAAHYVAVDSSDDPSGNVATAVDRAITDGLPWVRDTTMTGALASTPADSIGYLDALLNDLFSSPAARWAVWGDGRAVVAADPTTPDYILLPDGAIMGVADDDYATHGFGRFVDAMTGTPPQASSWDTATASDAAGATEFGRRERPVSLTDLGTLTTLTAAPYVDTWLSQAAARMGWTGGFSATTDQLRHIGGAPVNLGLVRAGQMVRICGVADQHGAPAVGAVRDVVLGETSFSEETGILDMNPLGMASRSIVDAIAASPREDTRRIR